MTHSNTSAAGGAAVQEEQGATRGADRFPMRPQAGASLVTEHGRTTIADEVVAKIAGMAAREIPGVYDFGTGAARAFEAIKGRLGGEESLTRGIDVEVGEQQAAADIHLIVEYGTAIPDLAEAVRGNVTNAVEHMCGLEVTEVNVAVDDVHLPRQEAATGTEAEPRVR